MPAASAVILAGCLALQAPDPGLPGPGAGQPKPVLSSGRDGASWRTAIIIQGNTEDDGVPAEYAWIRQHRPGCTLGEQTLEHHGGKPFDVFDIESPGGVKTKLYVDISAFFGKFEAPDPGHP